MRTPIFVRPLTEVEQEALKAGLRSTNAFVLRRCQILLESRRGERAPQIAQHLSCDDQTVLDALHAFNEHGLAALARGSSRPQTIHPAFSPEQAQRLRALLHRSPREFGKPTSLWTLDLLAEVSCQEGLTPHLVTGETIRQTCVRLGIQWKRAKHWITSPDVGYTRKKTSVTA
jgi:transposase